MLACRHVYSCNLLYIYPYRYVYYSVPLFLLVLMFAGCEFEVIRVLVLCAFSGSMIPGLEVRDGLRRRAYLSERRVRTLAEGRVRRRSSWRSSPRASACARPWTSTRTRRSRTRCA